MKRSPDAKGRNEGNPMHRSFWECVMAYPSRGVSLPTYIAPRVDLYCFVT